MLEKRPRDENGWRIPQEGTMARRVYDMVRAGASIPEIQAVCPQAIAHIFHFKNPDYGKARGSQRRRQETMQIRRANARADSLLLQRLNAVERERDELLEQLKEANLRNGLENWVANVGEDRARAIARLIWPDNPAYAPADAKPAA